LTPAPGTTEVQTVEVGDLAVAAVADGGWGEEGRGLPFSNPRKELLEPDRKERRVGALHAQGFDQGWRKELVAARLPRLAVAVIAEPVANSLPDQLRKVRIECLRPLQRQDQREGRVEMGAYAYRVGQDWEEIAKAFGERSGERFEAPGPILWMPHRFKMQIKKPCPAVGP